MSNNLPENLEEKASDLLVRVHPAGTGRGAGGGHVPWPAGPARGAAESQSQQPGGSTFFPQPSGVWDWRLHWKEVTLR